MDKPKLIVFDLNMTLWPFWIEGSKKPPYVIKNKQRSHYDVIGTELECFPESTRVLKTLVKEGYTLAVASSNPWMRMSFEMINHLKWRKYFTYIIVQPGQKKNHFETLQIQSGVDYSEMLFFDDDDQWVTDMSKLGVVGVRVDNGMSFKTLKAGLKIYHQKQNGL